MHCERCGASILPTDKFCIKCGDRLSHREYGPSPTSVVTSDLVSRVRAWKSTWTGKSTPELSQFQRLAKTFTSPRRTFADIRRSPKCWLPFAFIMLYAFGLSLEPQLEAAPYFKAYISDHINNTETLTPRQQDVVEITEKMFFIGTPAIVILCWGGGALVLWVLSKVVIKGAANYPQVLAVCAFSSMPTIMNSLVGELLAFQMYETSPTFRNSPLDPTNAASAGVPHWVVFFNVALNQGVSIWSLVLLVIGIIIVSDVGTTPIGVTLRTWSAHVGPRWTKLAQGSTTLVVAILIVLWVVVYPFIETKGVPTTVVNSVERPTATAAPNNAPLASPLPQSPSSDGSDTAESAPSPGTVQESMEMDGTVGTYRVGLNYTVRDGTDLVAAHYFYASQLKDIQLTGAVQGQTVDFKGNDGSVFHLHFVGNGSNGTEPLTFRNSIGLSGTWALGSRMLPVILTGGYSTANPGQRLYADVTDEPDAEFEAMVQAAKSAILSGDSHLVAKYVDFPLRVNTDNRHLVLHNFVELDENWSSVFPTALIEKIRLEVPHEMFVHEGQVMLGQGELWFDDKGLESVNVE